MEGCGVACYVWGMLLPICVDILVSGNSLREHGMKAKMYLCINDDTLQMKVSQLFKAFSNLVPVTHSGLPPVAAATGRERKEKVATRLLEKVIRRLELRERSVAEINTVDGEKSGSAVVFGRRELKESGMQEIRS